MPKLDGIGAAAEMRRAAPGTAVVVLTTFGESDYIARAFDCGASGFLLEPGDPHELVAGVRGVAEPHPVGDTATAAIQLGQFAAFALAMHALRAEAYR